MKKLIMTILALTISNIANAEYTIKINLENEPIKFTNWQEYESIYGEWTNNNELYGCSNWTPLPNEVTINLEFTQTATDCNQDQTRTVQDQTIDTVSNQVVNDGEPYTESRTITVSDTRQAIGTMETWVATIPLYITDWTNVGGIYGCNTWSPDPSTVTINQSFTQTSNDCDQDQERTRQDREQETTTNEIRNVGTPVIETRTIAASSTRNAIGTKVVKDCRYQYKKIDSTRTYADSGWGGIRVIWNNSIIFNKTTSTPVSSWSYTTAGYKYTIGNYVELMHYIDVNTDEDYYHDNYQVCREPV